MNVEKLNSIIWNLHEDFSANQTLQKLQSVTNTLQNVINQPNNGGYQTNLTNQLNALYESLKKSIVNDFSPAWNQTLKELGVKEYLGNSLKTKIEQVFATNQITPASAKQKLDEYQQKLTKFFQGLEHSKKGLSALNIGYDELDDDECEIGVMIPREFISNDVKKLGEEIKEIDFIFQNFSELITGQKEPFELKSLSTSEPIITFATSVAIAGGIAKTIGWLIDNYKKLLEIKKLHNELKAQGVEDDKLKGVEDHCNSIMKDTINTIVIELEKEYHGNGDENRKHELLNGLRISLNKISNRIDRGFNFEVRIAPQEEDSEEKEVDEIKDQIRSSSSSLEFIKTGGKPILKLPESEKKTKK